ncbi:hypothetical protein ROA7450_04173 [Roseovarius albus]|uniref:Uncharacterized protein n=1 Tax=Roseovarius albus TaxID=1247867 RepID=A0A1X7A9X4_9RHOB|nr:hypothetical protein ROA7450_04173 [Roseovarius albus]
MVASMVKTSQEIRCNEIINVDFSRIGIGKENACELFGVAG